MCDTLTIKVVSFFNSSLWIHRNLFVTLRCCDSGIIILLITYGNTVVIDRWDIITAMTVWVVYNNLSDYMTTFLYVHVIMFWGKQIIILTT